MQRQVEMIEKYVEHGRKKSEKEIRCWEGKRGHLPHAVWVQKWRVYKALVVLCYHGNIGKQGRVESSLNKNLIDSMGKSSCQSEGFSVVIAVEYLCAWFVPTWIEERWIYETWKAQIVQTQAFKFKLFFKGSGLFRVQLSFFSRVHPCFFFWRSCCLSYHMTLSTHPTVQHVAESGMFVWG